MDNEGAFGRCLTYLDSQYMVHPGQVRFHNADRVAVAISREAGSGAIPIAEKLAEYLQAHTPSNDRPWTVFDKNLIETVLEDHHLPARLAKFLPEDRISAINDTVDEILGLHPPSWVLIRQSTETMLRLAELGNVILVGRGATVVTSRLPHVLRVRLVGSLEKRVARVQETERLSQAEARASVRRQDHGRAWYVRKFFRRDNADVLVHDLVINTDRLSEQEVAKLIGDTTLLRVRSATGELAQVV